MSVDLSALRDVDKIAPRVHLSPVPTKEENETQDKVADAMSLASLATSMVRRSAAVCGPAPQAFGSLALACCGPRAAQLAVFTHDPLFSWLALFAAFISFSNARNDRDNYLQQTLASFGMALVSLMLAYLRPWMTVAGKA